MPLINQGWSGPLRENNDVELEVGLPMSPPAKGADKWNLNESKVKADA